MRIPLKFPIADEYLPALSSQLSSAYIRSQSTETLRNSRVREPKPTHAFQLTFSPQTTSLTSASGQLSKPTPGLSAPV